MKQKGQRTEDPRRRYNLCERLGKGSYGAVYKAIDTVSSEIVAIKIIPLSVTESAEFSEVKKEIEMLRVRGST
jgi:serine/threonine protein kinase